MGIRQQKITFGEMRGPAFAAPMADPTFAPVKTGTQAAVQSLLV
jgi:hypothetical protein